MPVTEPTSSMRVQFDAMEFQSDESFKTVSYEYVGSEEKGWTIYREGKAYLELPDGYRLLKTVSCGVCSTDIARAKLSFPLPQITGHEVVAMDGETPVVVEINASHFARGVESDCYYCNNGLANHCPDRLTLGIDRLPGGFAPYILAPKNAISSLPPDVSPQMAIITEPLAAAIHAVQSTPIENNQSVVVVGAGRLGSLLILALSHWRKQKGLNFSINAIIRNKKRESLAVVAGADKVWVADELSENQFNIVFDTSGTPSGFATALTVAKDVVHLKSTSGELFEGLNFLTRFVIDELTLKRITKNEIGLLLLSGKEILFDESLIEKIFDGIKPGGLAFYNLEKENIPSAKNETCQFDIIVTSDLTHLNKLLQPSESLSYLKPKGTVFYSPIEQKSIGNKLTEVISQKNISLLSSRCGDFNEALALMQQMSKNVNAFLEKFLTHEFTISEISTAFTIASADSECVKAVIKQV